MNLIGKTVILTGATGGIGSVLATALAKEEPDLILLGRNPDRLSSLASHLQGDSLKMTTYACDLTDHSSRAKIIKQIVNNHPKIDILINCAGIGIYKPFLELTAADWYSSYELNVNTPFFLAQTLQPSLTLNLGSCSAVQYRETRTLYNSTKAALRSLTLCLAKELPGNFVHLALDSTLTPFGPLTLKDKREKVKNGKYYLSPDWVAKQIVSIIKDDKRHEEYVLSPDCYDNCGVWQKP